jgi:hypothetical protein
MRKLKVEVSGMELATAEKSDSRYCMIAEAIRRMYPELRNIQVDTQSIRVTDRVRREQLTFMSPATAQVAIVRFDEGDTLRPFEFECKEPRVRKLRPLGEAGKGGRVAHGEQPGVPKTRTKAGAYRIGRLRVHGLRAVGRAAEQFKPAG